MKDTTFFVGSMLYFIFHTIGPTNLFKRLLGAGPQVKTFLVYTNRNKTNLRVICSIKKRKKIFFYSTTTSRYFWDPTSPYSSNIWRNVTEEFPRNLSIGTVKYAWFYTYITLTCLYDVVFD